MDAIISAFVILGIFFLVLVTLFIVITGGLIIDYELSRRELVKQIIFETDFLQTLLMRAKQKCQDGMDEISAWDESYEELFSRYYKLAVYDIMGGSEEPFIVSLKAASATVENYVLMRVARSPINEDN